MLSSSLPKSKTWRNFWRRGWITFLLHLHFEAIMKVKVRRSSRLRINLNWSRRERIMGLGPSRSLIGSASSFRSSRREVIKPSLSHDQALEVADRTELFKLPQDSIGQRRSHLFVKPQHFLWGFDASPRSSNGGDFGQAKTSRKDYERRGRVAVGTVAQTNKR